MTRHSAAVQQLRHDSEAWYRKIASDMFSGFQHIDASTLRIERCLDALIDSEHIHAMRISSGLADLKQSHIGMAQDISDVRSQQSSMASRMEAQLTNHGESIKLLCESSRWYRHPNDPMVLKMEWLAQQMLEVTSRNQNSEDKPSIRIGHLKIRSFEYTIAEFNIRSANIAYYVRL